MENIVKKFDDMAAAINSKIWKVVEKPEIVFEIPYFGKVVKYALDVNGKKMVYHSLIRSFGWVVVFGVTTENELVTIVQWKPGVNLASWELPPGGIGKLESGTPLETILEKTKMAFLKETGYGEGNFEILCPDSTMIESGKFRGASFEDHGLPAYIVLATDLKKIQGARNPEENEIMGTLLVPLKQIPEVIFSNKFKETSALSCALISLIRLGKLAWTI